MPDASADKPLNQIIFGNLGYLGGVVVNGGAVIAGPLVATFTALFVPADKTALAFEPSVSGAVRVEAAAVAAFVAKFGYFRSSASFFCLISGLSIAVPVAAVAPGFGTVNSL